MRSLSDLFKQQKALTVIIHNRSGELEFVNQHIQDLVTGREGPLGGGVEDGFVWCDDCAYWHSKGKHRNTHESPAARRPSLPQKALTAMDELGISTYAVFCRNGFALEWTFNGTEYRIDDSPQRPCSYRPNPLDEHSLEVLSRLGINPDTVRAA